METGNLVQRAKDGDKDSFALLYKEIYKDMYSANLYISL